MSVKQPLPLRYVGLYVLGQAYEPGDTVTYSDGSQYQFIRPWGGEMWPPDAGVSNVVQASGSAAVTPLELSLYTSQSGLGIYETGAVAAGGLLFDGDSGTVNFEQIPANTFGAGSPAYTFLSINGGSYQGVFTSNSIDTGTQSEAGDTYYTVDTTAGTGSEHFNAAALGVYTFQFGGIEASTQSDKASFVQIYDSPGGNLFNTVLLTIGASVTYPSVTFTLAGAWGAYRLVDSAGHDLTCATNVCSSQLIVVESA